MPDPQQAEASTAQVQFNKSVEYNYINQEFVRSPLGRQYLLDETDSWIEWCVKALSTPRYKHLLVYSTNYGSELHTLIGKCYSHEFAESEIRRMVRECLLANERTAAVENFVFEWIDDGVIFTCSLTNTRGETKNIIGKVVV